MNSNIKLFVSSIFAVVFNALIQSANCDKLSDKELIALTRDHTAREDPDALLYGFIPVWAIVIYCIAASFLVVAILSGFCYLVGCRTPARHQKDFRALAEYS